MPNGPRKLKTNLQLKKKFIYLISPSKIENPIFFKHLNKILKLNKVSFFQLRIKKETFNKKLTIGKKIKKITKKNGVKLLINDDPFLAKKLNADGCHLGQKDMKILQARKILKNKIIGITCHNSLNLVKQAIKNKANYIAIGAFFPTKTKNTERYL